MGIPRFSLPSQSPFGLLSAPASGTVAGYVRSTGVQDGDDGYIQRNMNLTLNAALAKCRAGRGDTVYVLPGHVENISSADYMSSLKAGTNIIGLGDRSTRPVFTWSAAAATFLLDVAGVKLQNMDFQMAGPSGTTAITVAAPMTISAAGCSLVDIYCRAEIDADQGATIAIKTTAAADDLLLDNVQIIGEGDGTLVTTFFDIIGADRLVMRDCYFAGISSVAVGVVRFATTASLNIQLERNVYINRFALSTCAVTGLAAVSGISVDESFNYLDDASDTAWLTSQGIMHFNNAQITNLAGENSIPATPQSV